MYILALEMASPVNQHCANCIGALSFPMRVRRPAGQPGGRLTEAGCVDEAGMSWIAEVRRRQVEARRQALVVVVEVSSAGRRRRPDPAVHRLLPAAAAGRRLLDPRRRRRRATAARVSTRRP